MSVLIAISQLLRQHLTAVTMAQAATVLAVFGGDLNRLVRRSVRAQHFLVRFGTFTFLCAFGYGVLSVLAARLMASLLARLNNALLAPTVAATFLLIGLAAEKKRKI